MKIGPTLHHKQGERVSEGQVGVVVPLSTEVEHGIARGERAAWRQCAHCGDSEEDVDNFAKTPPALLFPFLTFFF